MKKTLAGTIFCYNATSQDYCLEESVNSLLEFCDGIYIVDAGSTDETKEVIFRLLWKHENIWYHSGSNQEWHRHAGKEKLSHFTNIAIEAAERDGFEYVFNLQADEIVHEVSYPYIKEAVKTGVDAFMVKRINLWGNPYLALNVPQHRKPCSTEIVRLAKSNYRTYDDAESIAAPASLSYLNDIRIYHMGFVRDRKIHPAKIRHMQAEIFQIGVDPRLEGMEVFDPYKWFGEEDLKPIEEPLPKIIQKWALERM